MAEDTRELDFRGAISINRIPGTSEYLVLEHGGKVYRFNDKAQPASKDLIVDFNADVPASLQTLRQKKGYRDDHVTLFSCTFDPNYQENGYIYFCLVLNAKKSTTHISRFSYPVQKAKLNPQSELNILTCDGGGHNGCTLLFGPDQLLYISLGDLGDANPPDGRNTGQDISDLYASILRIDVRNATQVQPYSIPSDNPFVNVDNAKPEVYAYGLRNPFRMAFDPRDGQLWVGDVGWEAWEMIYRIRNGGNYGWSVKEGTGEAKPGKFGPTPILDPDVQLSHAEAASITGGVFYQGKALPELHGAYVFGDWVTRKFWSIRPTIDAKLVYEEAAAGEVKPICFELDEHGELLVLDYNETHLPSAIYRLVRNEANLTSRNAFPTSLSESGLFADIKNDVLAQGVYRYSINETMWADGAIASYYVAIPSVDAVEVFQKPLPCSTGI